MEPMSLAPMPSNAAGLALNLTVATLGNIVGGALIVALGYWFIYANREA